MCLAVPARLIKRSGPKAEVDVLGNTTEVDVSLLPDVGIGDYVLIHTGMAIQQIDPEDARQTLDLLNEMMKNQDNK